MIFFFVLFLSLLLSDDISCVFQPLPGHSERGLRHQHRLSLPWDQRRQVGHHWRCRCRRRAARYEWDFCCGHGLITSNTYLRALKVGSKVEANVALCCDVLLFWSAVSISLQGKCLKCDASFASSWGDRRSPWWVVKDSYCKMTFVISLSNIRLSVDPKGREGRLHVRVTQSQHLFLLCVTAGQELHVRLRECATALTLTFDLAWLRLEHTPCQPLTPASHPEKPYNPSPAAPTTPAAHSCSVIYYFFVFLVYFFSLFYGAESCLMQAISKI